LQVAVYSAFRGEGRRSDKEKKGSRGYFHLSVSSRRGKGGERANALRADLSEEMRKRKVPDRVVKEGKISWKEGEGSSDPLCFSGCVPAGQGDCLFSLWRKRSDGIYFPCKKAKLRDGKKKKGNSCRGIRNASAFPSRT